MKLSLFSLLIIVPLITFSQSPFGSSKQRFDKSLFFIELIGGVSAPSMTFSGTDFDSYNKDKFVSHTEGMSFRVQFSQCFSIGSQITFRKQGTQISEFNNYSFITNNINLHIPLEFECNFSKKKKKVYSKALLFAGPYIAQNIGGSIVSDEINQPITLNDIAKLDYGIETGIGIRIPTFSATTQSNLTFKLSYVLGLANTFPDEFNYDDLKLNQLLISKNGNRFNNGLRLIICIELPMKAKRMTTFTAGGDGKRTFKRFVIH